MFCCVGIVADTADIGQSFLGLGECLLGGRAGAPDGVLGIGEETNGLAPVILVPYPREDLVLRIDLEELVRACPDGRVVLVGVGIDVRPDVLRVDDRATHDLAPEHLVLARAGLRHFDDDGEVICGVDIGEVLRVAVRQTTEVVVLRVHSHLQRPDHVISREGLAVVPRHTLAEVDRELGIVVVVLPALAQPWDQLAGGVVDVPEELDHDLLSTVLIVPAVGDHGVEAVEDREVNLVVDDDLVSD